MRQKLLLTMLLLLSIVAPFAAFADSFTVKTTDLTVGTTETLQFNLENSQAAYGFQAEVKLPAGLTAVKGSDGQYITLSERADGGNYSVNSNILNGNLIMGAFSGDHKPLAGNSGALVNLNVKVADDFKGGKIEILNASLIDSQDKDVAISSSSADLGVAVSTVTFVRKSLTLQVGKTTTLVPTVTPSWASNQTLTWESDDESVATVSTSGVVTAVKVGKANITATSSNGKTATCAVNVETNVIEVTSITLDATELNLTAGETKTLVATVSPENATDKSVVWTSDNEKVATVDEDGNVTAIAKGTATITAEAHGHTATCKVTVANKTVAVTGVTLNKTTLSLTEGETGTLTATVSPSDATDKTVTWTSSDEKIATVKNGIVTAIAPGTATITVTASGKTATCEVTVKAKTISVTGVTLDKTTLNMTEGDKATLTATIAPENATDKSVTWTSSNTAVATVDVTGNVTAVAPGTATITAKAAEKTATCAVTVAAKIIPATGVTLSNTTSELKVGETVNLTATVTPEDATDKTIVWTSSDEAIATVDATGKVTAKAIGEATVTATCGTAKATCKVTVSATEVVSISFTRKQLTMKEGDTTVLTPNFNPTTATDKSVTWKSSDEAVATVSSTGEVTAVKEGTAIITVTTTNGKTASIPVTVSANIISVTSISISKTVLNLTEGDKDTLTATVAPADATDPSVEWSSDNTDVVIVSENGEVTAVKAGTATITAASSNGKTATCAVTVAAKVIDVTGITLDKTSLSLTEGETATLTATVAPADATDKNLTWTSSDEKIATVKDGVVTAVAAGSATITATASGKTATCEVTVKAKTIAVTGVTLDKTSLNLTEGETATLTATVAPADATDKNVTWTSSDEKIATVKDGIVTAVAAGSATITATASGKTATCEVTVKAKTIAVTGVTLNTAASEIKVGETVNLTATVVPENATDKTVVWTSSDEAIAAVDANGKVTAKAIGEATITATCGTAKATCKVTVIPTPVESVKLSNATLTMTEGDIATLTATITPATATDKSVSWSSSDESVATVSSTGEVAALKNGTATITATSSNGKTATCTVTVKADIVSVTAISVNKTELNLTEGDMETLTATITPDNATDKSVTWTSSDESVATVSASGEVTAVKAGSATITAASSNGKTVSCNVTVEAKIIAATGVTLDKTTCELKVDEYINLTATVTPEDATDKTVVWTSSNQDIATVDANGKVTAKTIGEATITATCGTVSATCKVTVIPTPVESIAISDQTLSLTEGDKATLTATVTPDNATDKSVAWTSSDESVATVSTTGEVTAVKAGKATITATASNGMTATCTVTVAAKIIVPTSLTLDKTAAVIKIGETVTLNATVAPENASDKTVTWSSSNETIATVDQTGKVTAVASGKAVITAKVGELTAECTITVRNPENEDYLYEITPDSWTPADLAEWVNDNDTYVTQTIDGGLKMTGTNTAWDSTKEITFEENSIVTLTATLFGGNASGRNGSYDFIRLGGVEVRLYGQDKKATVVIGDTETPLTGFTRGADYEISITVNQATKEVTVIVSGGATGEVTGKLTEDLPNDVSVGHYKAGKENYEIVEILKSISISEELQEVTNAPYTLNYLCDGEIIKSEEGTAVIGNEITAVSPLTVDEQKYYFADGATTSMIISEDGSANVLNVDMRKAYVYSYTVKNNVNAETVSGTCEEGNNITIPYSRYILTDDNAVWMKDAINKEYNYTFTPDTDNYVATLEYAATDITDGIYFIEGENIEGMSMVTRDNANIRCSNGAGGYADEAVEVYTLKPGTYKVRMGVWGNPGATFTLKAGEDIILSAETKGYWYEAATEEALTVTEETAITFEGATNNKPLDYILITGEEVVYVPVTSLVLLDEDDNQLNEGAVIELHTGHEYNLTAVVGPENATDKTVTWTTSDETVVSFLDDEGLLDGLKAGEATVTASIAGFSVSVKVKVIDPEIPVTGISLDKTKAEMLTGETLQLTATIDPENATSKDVTWASSDKTIATVSNKGLVKALKAGKVTITVSSNKKTATCEITITDPYVSVTEITLDKTEASITEGETLQLEATVTPEDATDATVIWTSSDEFVATVDENGLVTALSMGQVVITAQAGDKTAECTVTVDKYSAVELIGLDSKTPMKVFDLNGIYVSDSVDGLQKGTYIVVQGNDAKKIRIR